MPNLLTGAPASSQATSAALRQSLSPLLVGLLNTGGPTQKLVQNKRGGKGGSFGVSSILGKTSPLPGTGGFTDDIGGGVFGGSTPSELSGGKGKRRITPSWSPGDPIPKGYSVMDIPGREEALASFGYDPAQFSSISKSLSQYSSPDYLDVTKSPDIQRMIEALTSQSNMNLGQNLAGLRSSFATHGQTGAETSSPLAQAASQTVGHSQQSLSDMISQALFGEFQNRENLQQSGISEEQQFNMLPVNIIAALAPLLSKSKGATPSPMDAISNLIGAVGGAAGGGAAAMCWVAREVFGATNPKWVRFRQWLTTKAPKWLLGLYTKYGEDFAYLLKLRPWLKVPVRLAMEAVI